ncbi:hypothetical protein JHN49_23970, partial [Streptomyces sp. MBT57]|nr:hypothetical protein [Streptomyces sp. MBT57]
MGFGDWLRLTDRQRPGTASRDGAGVGAEGGAGDGADGGTGMGTGAGPVPEAGAGAASGLGASGPGWDGGWRQVAPPAVTVARSSIGVSDGLRFRSQL